MLLVVIPVDINVTFDMTAANVAAWEFAKLSPKVNEGVESM